jgi:hypothetical protein
VASRIEPEAATQDVFDSYYKFLEEQSGEVGCRAFGSWRFYCISAAKEPTGPFDDADGAVAAVRVC